MRPQQQGRRSRNRGSGRRNQNPLQRSYESNGPDVKIRGNAQVIADKYATLARDALSSGDTVMAENYLQHAEHYNRIILAAQPQPREDDDEQDDNPQQASGDDRQGRDDGQQQQGRRNRNRRDRDERNEDAEDGQQQNGATAETGDSQADAGAQPQPVIDGTPAEVREEEAQQTANADEPAKPKRPRKPRKKPADIEASSGDETDGKEAPVAAE
ncbi:DUF4167 domain-containing protein [Oceaniradius stylonematis]|uniref:DUF4167 domain-containing protein n=1 Tax=Oceaniradius stylonematis TaxID=2184161 RepID=UPI000D6D340D|nr:DUF4167 domain-containing protein [Oceaniradius stylonematis]RNC96968.1 MAG: DUF4167 domain-containing protein [Oricola sp.]